MAPKRKRGALAAFSSEQTPKTDRSERAQADVIGATNTPVSNRPLPGRSIDPPQAPHPSSTKLIAAPSTNDSQTSTDVDSLTDLLLTFISQYFHHSIRDLALNHRGQAWSPQRRAHTAEIISHDIEELIERVHSHKQEGPVDVQNRLRTLQDDLLMTRRGALALDPTNLRELDAQLQCQDNRSQRQGPIDQPGTPDCGNIKPSRATQRTLPQHDDDGLGSIQEDGDIDQANFAEYLDDSEADSVSSLLTKCGGDWINVRKAVKSLTKSSPLSGRFLGAVKGFHNYHRTLTERLIELHDAVESLEAAATEETGNSRENDTSTVADTTTPDIGPRHPSMPTSTSFLPSVDDGVLCETDEGASHPEAATSRYPSGPPPTAVMYNEDGMLDNINVRTDPSATHRAVPTQRPGKSTTKRALALADLPSISTNSKTYPRAPATPPCPGPTVPFASRSRNNGSVNTPSSASTFRRSTRANPIEDDGTVDYTFKPKELKSEHLMFGGSQERARVEEEEEDGDDDSEEESEEDDSEEEGEVDDDEHEPIEADGKAAARPGGEAAFFEEYDDYEDEVPARRPVKKAKTDGGVRFA